MTTEREGTEQPQRYCGKCGASVRPENAFCTSCGERLDPEAQHDEFEGVDDPTPAIEPWAPTGRTNGDGSRPGPRVDYRQVLERIKNLPMALKIAGVVVGALLLFTVLSPLGMVIATLLFGVSVITLIVRVAQRRFPKWWGTIAVASLVLTIVFGGFAQKVGVEHYPW